jgi:hypothetical protein
MLQHNNGHFAQLITYLINPRTTPPMRTFTCLFLLLLTTPLLADDWLPLFNGRDLTGWRANNDPDSFKVENGILRCQASGSYKAHLFYVGDRTEGFESFKNFELEATVRAEPNSNGGIFVHTDMSTRDAAKHLAKGYEVQLNSSPKEKQKTGSLYAIVPVDTSPVDETQWFVIRIVVGGKGNTDKRITAAINGQQVLDYTEPENVVRPPERSGRLFNPSGAALALQAHDPQSIWYFKDIRVKRLP